MLKQQDKAHAQHTAQLHTALNDSQQQNKHMATELKEAKSTITR